MARVRKVVKVLMWLLKVASATTLQAREPRPGDRRIHALTQNATVDDLKWQPLLDYDKDACYNVAAIGTDGNINQGMVTYFGGAAKDCRKPKFLRADRSNTYSRQRCNNGWCVYIYDYYFAKDCALPYIGDLPGHVHDWEHIVVWTENGIAKYVAAGDDGFYGLRAAEDVMWEGTHPKLVYHKRWASRHGFRFAEPKDDKKLQNHDRQWHRSPLISYNGFPKGLRDVLYAVDFGKDARMATRDRYFELNIEHSEPYTEVEKCDFNEKCRKVKVRTIPQFDPQLDDGSPGQPEPVEFFDWAPGLEE